MKRATAILGGLAVAAAAITLAAAAPASSHASAGGSWTVIAGWGG